MSKFLKKHILCEREMLINCTLCEREFLKQHTLSEREIPKKGVFCCAACILKVLEYHPIPPPPPSLRDVYIVGLKLFYYLNLKTVYISKTVKRKSLIIIYTRYPLFVCGILYVPRVLNGGGQDRPI